MASKELRLPHSSSSGDTSTEDEEEHDNSMEEVQQDTSMEEVQQDTSMEEEEEEEPQDASMEDVSKMPPKMRIKLSLRMPKSPEENKEQSTPNSAGTTFSSSERAQDLAPARLKDDTEGAAQSTPTSSSSNKSEATQQAKDTSPPSKTGASEQAKDAAPPSKTDTDNGKDSTPSNKNDEDTESEADDDVVQATVVKSGDKVNDNDKEPVVVTSTVKKKSHPFKLPTIQNRSSAASKRRLPSRPALPTSARAVKLPPLSSPGMLIPPSAGVFRGGADANGYSTPASVFDHCMALGGYTKEARTENPHRGSSVRREVGDMFDSDVSLALNFPQLVPKGIWSLPKKSPEGSMDAVAGSNGETKDDPPASVAEEKKEDETCRDAAELLLRSLAPSRPADETAMDTAETSRKRRRPWQFAEMAPVSLTLPYPDSYVQERLRYVEKVKERERAIVASQEANQKFEDAQERFIRLSTAKRGTEAVPPPPVRPEPIKIPPIPEPVNPPRLSELDGLKYNGVDGSKHPIYPPKTHEEYTAHLDPACFHITNGRYFNIMTNGIADPTFVGPNAPGIAGLNLAGGSGLATAYAGSTTGSAAALKEAYYESVNSRNVSTGSAASKSSGGKSSSKKKSSGTVAASKSSVEAVVPVDVLYRGPTPTSTSTELKRLMDAGGDGAKQMRNAIIRAAVYAIRTDNSTMSFTGSNGEVYPDVSKAFAAHAGVRPCNRCKNNKQGAYHCRLRRKHKDLDYDGGNSPAALAPLFQEPLDDLLLGNK